MASVHPGARAAPSCTICICTCTWFACAAWQVCCLGGLQKVLEVSRGGIEYASKQSLGMLMLASGYLCISMLVAERDDSQTAEATFTGCAESADLCWCVMLSELSWPKGLEEVVNAYPDDPCPCWQWHLLLLPAYPQDPSQSQSGLGPIQIQSAFLTL